MKDLLKKQVYTRRKKALTKTGEKNWIPPARMKDLFQNDVSTRREKTATCRNV